MKHKKTNSQEKKQKERILEIEFYKKPNHKKIKLSISKPNQNKTKESCKTL